MSRLVLSLLIFWTTPVLAAWDLNDLSMLLPLPTGAADSSLMWNPRTMGTHGSLLPSKVYEKLPAVVTDLDRRSLYEKALKVVSVRIDPCFREGVGVRQCQHQIRMVWQPLVFEDGAWTTLDGTLHTFYVLSAPEWQAFTAELQALVTAGGHGTLGLPLQVHPILRREGYHGAFWRNLTTVVLKYCGERRLRRTTAMSVNPLGTVWFFTGLDIVGASLRPIQIPRIQDDTQGFATDAASLNGEDFRAAISPRPQENEHFLELMSDTRSARTKMTETDLMEAARTAITIENPRLHNTGTLDCATCHVGRAVSSWSRSRFPQWNWGRIFAREIYQGPGNMGRTADPVGRGNVLRAFGYFDREAVIAPRTIHETAEVLLMMTREEAFRRRRN